MIEGVNYTGKTSIIQAIYFGLFGDTLYEQLKPRDLKREGSKDAQVIIDICVDNKDYRIIRNIKGAKGALDSHLWTLKEGNQIDELQSVSGKDNPLSKLDNIFKVSKKYVQLINFIQEWSISLYIKDPKTKILEDIYSILNLNYFQSFIDYCGGVIKNLEKDQRNLEEQHDKIKEFLEKNELDQKKAQKEFEKLSKKKESFENKLSESNRRLEKFNALENHIKQKDLMDSQIFNQNQNKQLLLQDLNEFKKDLEDINKSEQDLIELKIKYDKYNENKNKLKSFNEQKENIQRELSEAIQNDLLLKELQSQLKILLNTEELLNNNIKALNTIENKFASIKKELEHYQKVENKVEALNNRIQTEQDVLDRFEKGECPITEEHCPVAEKFISQYTESLNALIAEIKPLNEELNQLANPEKEYNNLLEKKEKFKDSQKELKSIKSQISTMKERIQKILDSSKLKEELESKLDNIKILISDVENVNKSLEKHYMKYIQKTEEVKNKNKLDKKLEEKDKQIKNIETQIVNLNNDKKVQEEKIKTFVESNDLKNISEKEKEEQRNRTFKIELDKAQGFLNEIGIKTKFIENELKKLLNPYNSKEEFYSGLTITVHEKQKFLFFQKALNLTLEELKNVELKAIQNQCNEMWCKFKSDSTRYSIELDDDLLPILHIGDKKRSIYQLSASEKLYLFLSIRATLLAELGPTRFLIIDNLLNDFAKKNHKIVVEELKKAIETTNIKQILFTGFDLSPDIKYDKWIKI